MNIVSHTQMKIHLSWGAALNSFITEIDQPVGWE